MAISDPVALLAGTIAGPTEFAQCIRNMLELAAQQGWKHMVWSDANFEDWPLREKSVVDALQCWVGPGRKLTMLAKRYNQVPLRHPRFAQWRSTWGHLVDCRVVRHLDDTDMPSALLGPEWFLHRRDVVRSGGICSSDVRARVELTERLDECIRQSSPGFPVTTLGL